MSILRQAWEGRSTITGLPDRGTSAPSPVPGYGEQGAGSWGPGMTWQSWGSYSDTSPEAAMRLSAVFACLRLLSEAISTLPLDLYRRTEGARIPVSPPDYLAFHPPLGSRITYLSQVMLSLLTDGNAFVYTPRDELGVPVALIVLDPSLVKVTRSGSQVSYVVEVPNQSPVPLSSFEIMHIAGMMLPGHHRGVSPLQAAREVVKGGQKTQEFGTSFFDNSAVPPAVIEVPQSPGVDREMAKEIARTWHETHGGTSNAGKVGVLLGGAQLKTVAISPEDAEWLDSKRFGVSEIARFYGVPPHLIADASNSTSWGSGLAEQNLAFGQFSLRPWTERIEECHGRLLYSHGLTDVSVKLNLDALLRASLSDRYESYSTGIDSGFLTVNEARRYEDLPPVPWGDTPPSPASDPARDLAELIQKIYLGVGTVLTADEAREIANRAGADLKIPGPDGLGDKPTPGGAP